MNGPQGRNNDSPNPPRKVAWMPAGGAEKRTETNDTGAKMSSKREFTVYGVVVYTSHPNLLGGGKWECLRVEGGRALAGMHFRGYVKTMPDRPCLLLGLTDDECVFRLAAYIPDLEPYINGRGDISVSMDGPGRAFVEAVSEVDGQIVQLNDCPVIEVVESTAEAHYNGPSHGFSDDNR